MDAQKILSVLETYIQRIQQFKYEGISSKRADLNTKYYPGETDHARAQMCHLLFMCEQTQEFAKNGRLEKAFRWLGFIQGILWTRGLYTIDELAKHNMSANEAVNHSLERRG